MNAWRPQASSSILDQTFKFFYPGKPRVGVVPGSNPEFFYPPLPGPAVVDYPGKRNYPQQNTLGKKKDSPVRAYPPPASRGGLTGLSFFFPGYFAY